MTKVHADFIGPKGQRFGGVLLPYTPPRLLVGEQMYHRVDDPEDGEFLGCYVAEDPASVADRPTPTPGDPTP